MEPNNIIFSTFHHGFAGGSKNTSRLLHHLSQKGCDVSAYFFESPQYFTYTNSKVKIKIADQNILTSEVVENELLKTYAVTNQILNDVRMSSDSILFGANLFPYCNILLDVKSQLKRSDHRLIIHPVGSDIWQIGSQIESRVKWLLDHPLVNTIVTYSETFAAEIKEYFNIDRDIQILPPILEKDRFFPLPELERKARRQKLLLNEDDFIIHHHSSMRRVKCPEIVLDIVLKSSQLVTNRYVLIMSGPIPYNAIKQHDLNLTTLNGDGVFKYKTVKENLVIYWTGIIPNVEYLMQIADMELNASLHDSFNLSLMEAMACSLPVITSDIVGINQHILESGGGVSFPATRLRYDELNAVLKSEKPKTNLFEIDYAVNAILKLENDRSKSKQMGLAGAKHIVQKFIPEIVIKAFNNCVVNNKIQAALIGQPV